jgi:hypothetical protein
MGAEPQLLAALSLLLGGYQCAAFLGRSPWDFATCLPPLEMTGLSEERLRALLTSGHVEQNSWGGFVLTPTGAALAQQLFAGPAPAAVEGRPRWDGGRRQLRFRGVLVKQLLERAPTQIYLLTALEECGWPGRLDDPLPGGHADAGRRLRDPARSLNLGQAHRLLHFEAEPGSQGFRWCSVDSF